MNVERSDKILCPKPYQLNTAPNPASLCKPPLHLFKGRLSHAGADSGEADREAGADGGERRDPHGATLSHLSA